MSKAPKEYHLISLVDGLSHGGFISLAGAREYAREKSIESWEIYRGNKLVERHSPIGSVENTTTQQES
jgi:hypothetical protein